jgi:hypothetical protein
MLVEMNIEDLLCGQCSTFESSIKAFYSSIPGFLKQTKPIGDG